MREIKFRAWSKSEKRMYPVYQLTWALGDLYAQVDSEKDLWMRSSVMNLMQYTGLKDKNGVEIYEGDLVTWTIYPDDEPKRRKPVEVQFRHGVYFTDTTTPILGNIRPDQELEICGNIYENPELLK